MNILRPVSRTLGQNLPGNQRVSSESEETDCDCWPQDARQPPGPSTSAGSNSKKDPSGVNEAGVLFRLEEAAPKGIKSATNFHPQTRF